MTALTTDRNLNMVISAKSGKTRLKIFGSFDQFVSNVRKKQINRSFFLLSIVFYVFC